MKKAVDLTKQVVMGLLLCSIILLSTVPNANAEGVVYQVELNTGQIILKEKDIMEFGFEGKIHRIMIREVDESKENIQLTAFIQEAETPFYTTINKEVNNQFDFDRDGQIDLIIKLMEINEKEVTLYLITTEDIPKTEQKPTNENQSKINLGINPKGIAITFGIIIIGLILYLLLKKKKK